MGELLGHQLQPREIAALAYDAGWQDAEVLLVAVCVCLAESQGFTKAINVNPDGSRDRGPWQLNDIHKHITDEIAYDPKRATAEAFKLYVARSSSFEDWAAYTSGVYLHDSYLGRACVGVANFLGERFLAAPVPDHPDGTPYVHKFKTPIANYQFRLSGVLGHLDRARHQLGWQAVGKLTVGAVQQELAAGDRVAKATLPET
jgi:hypothetical protein